jgi:TonB-dependent SusC/RagA subfamily outer membrane receptor
MAEVVEESCGGSIGVEIRIYLGERTARRRAHSYSSATLEEKEMRFMGTSTSRRARALSATTITSIMAALAMGIGCAAHAPRSTDSAPARPTTSSSSDATLSAGTAADHSQSMEELIASRAPGVQVIHGDNGTFALRIRGLSSPSGITDPLIVIDGAVSSAPGAHALDGINPRDVLRIEVLKDAASTAFYGMRGGSGVILVTTRKN